MLSLREGVYPTTRECTGPVLVRRRRATRRQRCRIHETSSSAVRLPAYPSQNMESRRPRGRPDHRPCGSAVPSLDTLGPTGDSTSWPPSAPPHHVRGAAREAPNPHEHESPPRHRRASVFRRGISHPRPSFLSLRTYSIGQTPQRMLWFNGREAGPSLLYTLSAKPSIARRGRGWIHGD